MRDDYVNAIIKVRVPKWQIGQECSIYFPDTMSIKGICEDNSPTTISDEHTHTKCLLCGRTLRNPIAKERGYGDVCWKKIKDSNQFTLF